MSDLIYSLAIDDDFYNMIVWDRPVWLSPSGKGLRFIPNNHDEVQDALIIFGYKKLDFSNRIKVQLAKMIEDCHKENGEDALLDPWKDNKLLMLDAKNELKNLNFMGYLLVVNHEGLPENVNLGIQTKACLAECRC